jgi:hypothetical protein
MASFLPTFLTLCVGMNKDTRTRGVNVSLFHSLSKTFMKRKCIYNQKIWGELIAYFPLYCGEGERASFFKRFPGPCDSSGGQSPASHRSGPGFDSRSGNVGFVVDEVTWEVFSEYFGFPCQFSFHQMLHTHHHPGFLQQAD